MDEVDESPRTRIVTAALALLEHDGPDALSTRAVAAAAGVQAPTLYRLFGDKQGLLDAVAAHGFATHLADKTAVSASDDPVADLREGWDRHVAIGLGNPALYTLMYGPGRAASPAARAAIDVLARHIARIAAAGRLRVPEARAVALVHAAGSGTTLTLIATPVADRDPALSATAREAVIGAIATDAPLVPAAGPVGAAVALRAGLGSVEALTDAEQALLREWLDRIAAGTP